MTLPGIELENSAIYSVSPPDGGPHFGAGERCAFIVSRMVDAGIYEVEKVTIISRLG
jgi:hypothetical protein